MHLSNPFAKVHSAGYAWIIVVHIYGIHITYSKYWLGTIQNTKFFLKEKLKAYLFTLDDVKILFWYCIIQEDTDVS